MTDVTKADIDGLGTRVGKVELLEPKVIRNEEDIQKIFDSLDKIPEQNQKLLNKIVFLMLIPIGLALWQIATK